MTEESMPNTIRIKKIGKLGECSIQLSAAAPVASSHNCTHATRKNDANLLLGPVAEQLTSAAAACGFS